MRHLTTLTAALLAGATFAAPAFACEITLKSSRTHADRYPIGEGCWRNSKPVT